jgi:hypothetical protein
MKLITHPQLVPRLRKHGSIWHPHMPSWCTGATSPFCLYTTHERHGLHAQHTCISCICKICDTFLLILVYFFTLHVKKKIITKNHTCVTSFILSVLFGITFIPEFPSNNYKFVELKNSCPVTSVTSIQAINNTTFNFIIFTLTTNNIRSDHL